MKHVITILYASEYHLLQVTYPLEYIVGPRSTKSTGKGGGGSPGKKVGLKTDSSAILGSSTSSEYAQALKEFKLQWLRYLYKYVNV